MSQKDKSYKKEENKSQEVQEMTMAESRAYRANLAKESKRELSLEEKREAFRTYWAQEKSKYGKSKDLEQILWVHLKAISKDKPEDFDDGIKHFGLIKIR